MKHARIPILVMIVLCVFGCSAPAVAQVLAYGEKVVLQTATLSIDGVDVPIYYGGPTYVITCAKESSRQYPLYLGLEDNIRNHLIQVNGTVYDVTFESSSPEVASVDEYGFVTFRSEGTVTFSVHAGNSSIQIQVQVLQGPWTLNSYERLPIENVVKRLGFPNRRTSTTVSWPYMATRLDGIYYSFGGTSDIEVVHWHYDEYPTLFFRVQENSTLVAIQNSGWDCGYAATVRQKLSIR